MAWSIDETVRVVTHAGDDGSLIEVTFYTGEDGVPVVQVDTRDGVVRVNVNDGELATVRDGGARIVLPEHWTEYERRSSIRTVDDLAAFVHELQTECMGAYPVYLTAQDAESVEEPFIALDQHVGPEAEQ